MSNKLDPKTDPDQPLVYRIRLQGHLDRNWTHWFGDVTITLEEGGETLLTCPVVDQAALHGLLRKVRDLGLPLISVTRAQTDQIDGPDFKQPIEPTTLEGKQDGGN
jgi:hypothetical protein